MAFHRGPRIVLDDAKLILDAGTPRSYSGTGTTWSDLSGNGNNGTLINGVSVANKELVFDGVDDKVTTSYAPQFGNFTVCLVFKDTGSGQWGRIVDKGYQSGFFISSYFATSGANYIGCGIIEPNPPHGHALPYSPGNYHFFASVRNGTSHTIYLDGVQQTSNRTVSSALLNTQTISFGTWNVGTTQPYKGNLPFVQIYDRALTVGEIEKNYNACKHRFGLV